MADLLHDALDHAQDIVRGVPNDLLAAPTGCSWDVAGLMNHMVGGNRYFAASARGEQPDRALFSGDHTGGDAPAAYRSAADEAVEAWSRPGAIEENQFLWNIHLVEVLGHGWDLALATGQPRDIPSHLVDAAMEIAHQLPADQVRNEGVFGPELEPAADASPADRFAAFIGRAPGSGTSSG